MPNPFAKVKGISECADGCVAIVGILSEHRALMLQLLRQTAGMPDKVAAMWGA